MTKKTPSVGAMLSVAAAVLSSLAAVDGRMIQVLEPIFRPVGFRSTAPDKTIGLEPQVVSVGDRPADWRSGWGSGWQSDAAPKPITVSHVVKHSTSFIQPAASGLPDVDDDQSFFPPSSFGAGGGGVGVGGVVSREVPAKSSVDVSPGNPDAAPPPPPPSPSPSPSPSPPLPSILNMDDGKGVRFIKDLVKNVLESQLGSNANVAEPPTDDDEDGDGDDDDEDEVGGPPMKAAFLRSNAFRRSPAFGDSGWKGAKWDESPPTAVSDEWTIPTMPILPMPTPPTPPMPTPPTPPMPPMTPTPPMPMPMPTPTSEHESGHEQIIALIKALMRRQAALEKDHANHKMMNDGGMMTPDATDKIVEPPSQETDDDDDDFLKCVPPHCVIDKFPERNGIKGMGDGGVESILGKVMANQLQEEEEGRRRHRHMQFDETPEAFRVSGGRQILRFRRRELLPASFSTSDV